MEARGTDARRRIDFDAALFEDRGDDLEDSTVYFAGPKAIALFGSKALGGIKNRYQVTHDLQVATVYLHFLRTNPRLAAAWVGEEILAESRRDQKLPDAILSDDVVFHAWSSRSGGNTRPSVSPPSWTIAEPETCPSKSGDAERRERP